MLERNAQMHKTHAQAFIVRRPRRCWNDSISGLFSIPKGTAVVRTGREPDSTQIYKILPCICNCNMVAVLREWRKRWI